MNCNFHGQKESSFFIYKVREKWMLTGLLLKHFPISTVGTEGGYSVGNPSTVHRNNQDDDSLGEDDEDIDNYFNDLFPDRNRLDTVEEGRILILLM